MKGEQRVLSRTPSQNDVWMKAERCVGKPSFPEKRANVSENGEE